MLSSPNGTDEMRMLITIELKEQNVPSGHVNEENYKILLVLRSGHSHRMGLPALKRLVPLVEFEGG